jgi:hypothetical protein
VAAINGLFLLVCSSCVVLAIYAAPAHRAFAIGFLSFGIPYFAVANKLVGETPEQYLAPQVAFQALYPRIFRVSEVPTNQNSGYYRDLKKSLERAQVEGSSLFNKPGGGVVIQTIKPLRADFYEVGHAFFAIFLGVCGGILASTLRYRRRKAS